MKLMKGHLCSTLSGESRLAARKNSRLRDEIHESEIEDLNDVVTQKVSAEKRVGC